MKSFGIRDRILLAALAPAILVAILVSGMLVAEHSQRAHVEQHRRLSAVSRQLSAAAEYNLFVGNDEALARLLEAASSEPDVTGAAFLDPRGRVLASTVPPEELPEPLEVIANFAPPAFSESQSHWHGLPIRATNYGEFDLFAGTGEPPAPLLGQLLLRISNESLNADMRRYALKAAASAALMLLFGVLLALVLSRGLIRTLGDIGRVIEGIRHGRRELRVEYDGRDELGDLARGIHGMADAVEQTQGALAARVAEAALARSRFFAAASHDLRQPLQALGLFVARLGRDAHDTPLRAQVDQVVHSVRNLRGLLDTLLDYSRLSGQVYRIDEKPVRSVDLFAQVIEEFAAAAAEKHLVLRHRIADCWMITDRALLHRILINLVGNAIRHTHRGAILVACRRHATHARIEVWDTGPGIPPEHHATIFEELVQLDNPERDSDKGLGLGLAIVRRTADLLRHPVGLCSRPGQGSRFTVTVQLAPPPVVPRDEEPAAPGNPLETATVIVVGEMREGREQIANLLDGWDCPVIAVADADEARAWILPHGPPDAIVWDTAGGSLGTEQARAMLDWLETATGYRLPAVVVSSGPVPPLDEATGASPRLLLARPFRPARLRALLSRLLDEDVRE
jgi:signal transduction histidine kinase